MTKKEIQGSPQIDPLLQEGDSQFRHSLLVAMPGLQDGLFTRSVVYVCAHSEAGAMGIVVNQRLPDVEFGELLDQLKLPQSTLLVEPVVHFGGPVETGRGFVLHSTDFIREDTVRINDTLCLTGTVDILEAIAQGRGPTRSIFALGYAGWSAGQLENEIQTNSWLTIPADEELIFGTPLDGKWEKALSRLGIDPLALSADAGHA
ncbi:MAG: YqgE/AlgH family protein [Bdellovibrionales bacterium]|jgi:putative transcriptional regulator|nr:YqgE/AlgH family protein [Bdellovibrionales bacterium]